jgi:hypothetical protein
MNIDATIFSRDELVPCDHRVLVRSILSGYFSTPRLLVRDRKRTYVFSSSLFVLRLIDRSVHGIPILLACGSDYIHCPPKSTSRDKPIQCNSLHPEAGPQSRNPRYLLQVRPRPSGYHHSPAHNLVGTVHNTVGGSTCFTTQFDISS